LIPKAFFALGSVSYALLTRPLASSPRPVDAFRDAVYAAMRSFLSSISTAQEQASQVSTEAQYLAVSKYKHYAPDTDVLDSGLRVHWLGPKLSRSTILFLHGGGFNLAASSGHLEWLWDLKNDLAQQASISVVIPSYTLAPEGQYPLQLRQAAEVLQWLVEKQGKSPANVCLFGLPHRINCANICRLDHSSRRLGRSQSQRSCAFPSATSSPRRSGDQAARALGCSRAHQPVDEVRVGRRERDQECQVRYGHSPGGEALVIELPRCVTIDQTYHKLSIATSATA